MRRPLACSLLAFGLCVFTTRAAHADVGEDIAPLGAIVGLAGLIGVVGGAVTLTLGAEALADDGSVPVGLRDAGWVFAFMNLASGVAGVLLGALVPEDDGLRAAVVTVGAVVGALAVAGAIVSALVRTWGGAASIRDLRVNEVRF